MRLKVIENYLFLDLYVFKNSGYIIYYNSSTDVPCKIKRGVGSGGGGVGSIIKR